MIRLMALTAGLPARLTALLTALLTARLIARLMGRLMTILDTDAARFDTGSTCRTRPSGGI